MWLFSSSAVRPGLAATAYDFSFTTLVGGHPLPLEQFRGKVLLVVNTASKCGFTPQYDGLEKLFAAYRDGGLVVLGVPSNDFGGQEPGDNDGIAHFCKLNYGVTFPMAGKQTVTGRNAHPFYKWAREQAGFLGAPKWNFHKYLIGRHGEFVDYFNTTTGPDSKKLRAAIEAELRKD